MTGDPLGDAGSGKRPTGSDIRGHAKFDIPVQARPARPISFIPTCVQFWSPLIGIDFAQE